MNKKATKPIVLVLVFLGALFAFSTLLNKESKDITTTMDEAHLPIVNFVYNGETINELHGYTKQMDMCSMRESILPISEKRQMDLEVRTYGNTIEAVSYRVRSMDGERLLVEGDCADLQQKNDLVECCIVLPGIFEDNQEYHVELELTSGDQKIYYYTRIINAEKLYAEESLEFALQFHAYTFRNDAASFIPTYMDAATGDATTLNYVDLSCTLGQITWGKFEGVKLTEPVASFEEINHSYNVITLNYVMTNVNENGEVEYYNVEEYYRLRKNETRMYVLNFERTMNQIFRSENDFILGKEALQLGIRDKEVEYLTSDSGDCIAFVQEGDLWSYDRVNNSIVKVFSFRGEEGINERENWDRHDIRIIKVDEAGSISFAVCGYMNRGIHEGSVGVAVYHYDALAQTVEEELFIETDKSYEVLKSQLGKLLYVNEQKQCYIMFNDIVYGIDLTTFEMTTLVDGGIRECIAVSESGRYFAWIDAQKQYESDTIFLEDLKTGITHQIKADAGTYLRPITFIGDDFVYGTAAVGDIKTDEMDNRMFLMSKIEILNTSEEKQEIIKEYRPVTGKIGSVSVDENNIYVELVGMSDGIYQVLAEDTIMNRESEPANGVKVAMTKTDVKQTQISLTMKEIEDDHAERITAKHVLIEEKRQIAMDVQTEGYYYAYEKGEVLLATKNVSEAVCLANEKNGVVIDADAEYIFKRARSTTQNPISNMSIHEGDYVSDSVIKSVSAILKHEDASIAVSTLVENGQSPYQILSSALRDVKVLELKRCTIDELLYYIDQGTPVFAKIGNKQAVLLTGYTSSYVYYYDPLSGQTKTAEHTLMDEMLSSGGRYCIAYVK